MGHAKDRRDFSTSVVEKSVLDFSSNVATARCVACLDKCNSDVFVYKSLLSHYTEATQESDIKGLLEEYEEICESSSFHVLPHEAAHFIKHWNDSYTNQVLGFVQDKSWVLLSLTFHLLLLTHTHTHRSQMHSRKNEPRSESNWGALFDGKDLSNVKELRKPLIKSTKTRGELYADEILTCLRSMGAFEISKDIEK